MFLVGVVLSLVITKNSQHYKLDQAMPVRTCSMEPRSPLCHRVHVPAASMPQESRPCPYSSGLRGPTDPAKQGPTVTLCCQPNLRCQPDLRAASRPN